ncbi:unnamed protein product [Discula destructiva]
MRIYTRVLITRVDLGVDDYFCIVSWCLLVGYTGLMFKTFSLGMGRHLWDEPVAWIVPTYKWFTIATFVYVALTGTIKLTFLFFYYRVFSPRSSTKYTIIGGIVFVCCLNTGLFFATIFECTPVERSWNTSLPGHCFRAKVLPYFSGVTSSATDLFVLVLPMKLVWGLNLNSARKLRLVAIFGLGIFSCVASLIRLGMTRVLYDSDDATWTVASIDIWATIEVDVGIICSCLIIMPAFLDHVLPDDFKRNATRLWTAAIHTFSLRKYSSSAKTPFNPAKEQDKWAPYDSFQQNPPSASQEGLRLHQISLKDGLAGHSGIVVQTSADIENHTEEITPWAVTGFDNKVIV